MTKNKLLLLLALLLTAATGAMAQSGTPSVKKLTVPDTWTGDMTVFSAADLRFSRSAKLKPAWLCSLLIEIFFIILSFKNVIN